MFWSLTVYNLNLHINLLIKIHKSRVEHITTQKRVSYGILFLEIQDDIPSEIDSLVYSNRYLTILFYLKNVQTFVLWLYNFRLIRDVFKFKIRRVYHLLPTKNDRLYGEDSWVSNSCQSLEEVFDILDLSWLRDTKAVSCLESLLGIKV